jgi:hypothetical protein
MARFLAFIIIIIIIIIIIGKDTISFMQGIYTYIPEAKHVTKEHNVAAVLSLLLLLLLLSSLSSSLSPLIKMKVKHSQHNYLLIQRYYYRFKKV